MRAFAMLRRLNDYGMIFVLLLLGGLFSILTIEVRQADDPAGAKALAGQIVSRFGQSASVLIAVRGVKEDGPFADALAAELARLGVKSVRRAAGEPKDARAVLQDMAAKGQRLDAAACSSFTASWLLFADAPLDFPALGKPVVMQASGSRWPAFLRQTNLMNIASQISVIAVIAIGMTLVVISGGIDLSVGSLLALSAVVSARLIRDHAGGPAAGTAGMIAACAAAVLACGLAGGISGGMITLFGVQPFIATLAMMLMASGGAYLLANGESIGQVPESFTWLGRGAGAWGLPHSVMLMLLLYLSAHWMMKHTAFGRHLHAVGGNRDAAILSGVPVKRVLVLAYAACGLLAGLGGVLMASNLKSGSPTFGQMYELHVIAAVVVGGTSLSGGKGRIFSSLIGAFIIGVINNGMNLLGVPSYTQMILLGAVILAAVLVDRARG